mgnify:CR=1 FL=1
MAQLGIQLYTVRDAMAKDYTGTLREIARIGYPTIEGGGTGPLTVDAFNALMKELKLNPIGAHVGLDPLIDKPAEALAVHKAIGTKYIALSASGKSADDYKKLGERLSRAGKNCLERGITLQYHNHAHEFQTFGGKLGLEIIYETADPKYVKAQIDVGWVQRAGADPVAWLKKMKGRIVTIHLKDTTDGADPQWTEVGTGVLPLAAVAKAAKEIGVEYYFIEQDTCARPSLESAAISFTNARTALAL